MRNGIFVPQFRKREVEVPVSQSIPMAYGEPEVDMDIPIPDVRYLFQEFIPAIRMEAPTITKIAVPEIFRDIFVNIFICILFLGAI